MIGLLRYNLKIAGPTMIWTGLLVGLMTAATLWLFFRSPQGFNGESAGWLAEDMVPLFAAFFAGGVLDAEMKRGAHELLCSKRRPLWLTVLLRLIVALALALLVGAVMLTALYFGIRRFQLGWLLLAAVPSSLVLASISLWSRVRLGNAFMGFMVAIAVWVGDQFSFLFFSKTLGIPINPLLTLTSYTDRIRAAAAGALQTTPYVDWWWVNKLALVALAGLVFLSISRRVENLVEGD